MRMKVLAWVLMVLLIQRGSTNDDRIRKAKIISCARCVLEKNPEVKHFIDHDFMQYRHAEFLPVPGKDPKLYFLNERGHTIETVSMIGRSRRELNDIMTKKGFRRNKIEL